jgi:hypothetical protein
MPKSRTAGLDSVRSALARPIELDVLLSKAGQKDRLNLEKHLAAVDASTSESNAAHGKLWRRLARALATLAPLAVQTVGQQAVQFFIADGKYRMQVFALEDLLDGKISVYIPDVLADATRMKILTTESGGAKGQGESDEADETQGPSRFNIAAVKGQALQIDALSGTNTANPAPHYKNMLGWNRKALRVTLPVTASPAQVETVESLAALAARAWADKTPAAPQS